MVLWDKEGKKKGKEAELHFQKWLNKHKISFLFSDQKMFSFPEAFRRHKLSRPDFTVFLSNIGSIMVDVKGKTIYSYKGVNTIAVDGSNFNKYIRFQRRFHIHQILVKYTI